MNKPNLKLLDKLKTSVCIVTAKNDDVKAGLTVAWITPVSFNPWTIAFSIAPEKFSHKIISESGTFSVNILGDNQVEVAKNFGFTRDHGVDKFQNIPFEETEDGQIHLKECIAYFDCVVVKTVEVNGQTLFIGEVTNGELVDKDSDTMIMDYETFYGDKNAK